MTPTHPVAGTDEAGSPRAVAARAVRGSFYVTGSTGVTVALGLVRAVILTRLLLPEHFGVSELALFFVTLAGYVFAVGLDAAFVQRAEIDPQTESTYLTMRLLLTLLSAALVLAAVPLLAVWYPQMPALGSVALAYTVVLVMVGANAVQETALRRRMDFGRLATTNIVSASVMTITAPILAWYGWGVWSLVGEQMTGQLVRGGMVWGVYRPLRARLGWEREKVCEFWRFGRNIWMDANLNFLLQRFDHFWIGTALGKNALGFYSRAHQFSGYNRRALANPMLSVFFPAFARLQGDRLRLSQGFVRAAGVLIRASLGASLLLILAAPEGITLVLGARWLPMLLAFQLMVVYAALDPINRATQDLIVAAGQPNLVVRARLAQAVFFIPGVIVLSTIWGIVGAALAADLMMAVGAVLVFRYARRFVDYSTRALFLWPVVAFVVTGACVLGAGPWIQDMWLPLRLVCKVVFVSAMYGGVLWLAEREQLRAGWQLVWRLARTREI